MTKRISGSRGLTLPTRGQVANTIGNQASRVPSRFAVRDFRKSSLHRTHGKPCYETIEEQVVEESYRQAGHQAGGHQASPVIHIAEDQEVRNAYAHHLLGLGRDEGHGVDEFLDRKSTRLNSSHL